MVRPDDPTEAAAIINGRLCIRSSQTPDGSEKTSRRMPSATPSAATSKVDALRVRIATNGSASRLT